ncbi:hypothetical protein B0A55_13581, partial [Friedmanniomyces simplex]
RSLYILISRIAWACDIAYQKDAHGEDMIPPSYDYVAGFNVQPKPFPFELKPRAGRQDIVEEVHRSVWETEG